MIKNLIVILLYIIFIISTFTIITPVIYEIIKKQNYVDNFLNYVENY